MKVDEPSCKDCNSCNSCFEDFVTIEDPPMPSCKDPNTAVEHVVTVFEDFVTIEDPPTNRNAAVEFEDSSMHSSNYCRTCNTAFEDDSFEQHCREVHKEFLCNICKIPLSFHLLITHSLEHTIGRTKDRVKEFLKDCPQIVVSTFAKCCSYYL